MGRKLFTVITTADLGELGKGLNEESLLKLDKLKHYFRVNRLFYNFSLFSSSSDQISFLSSEFLFTGGLAQRVPMQDPSLQKKSKIPENESIEKTLDARKTLTYFLLKFKTNHIALVLNAKDSCQLFSFLEKSIFLNLVEKESFSFDSTGLSSFYLTEKTAWVKDFSITPHLNSLSL